MNIQVVIDANTRLAVAVGGPLPGNRDNCQAFTESGVDQACEGAQVMADGSYQGNPAWKQDLNTVHKRVRVRVEHALAHMESWNV